MSRRFAVIVARDGTEQAFELPCSAYVARQAFNAALLAAGFQSHLSELPKGAFSERRCRETVAVELVAEVFP